MLTYSSYRSGKGGESIVIKLELLLSSTSLGSLTVRFASTATAASSEATSASASATLGSLWDEVVFLSLEGKEAGEFGLTNGNVVNFLISQVVSNGLNFLVLGSSLLNISFLDLFVASSFLLLD